MELVISYEWLPPQCVQCLPFGHQETSCLTIPTWVPKSLADSGENTLEAGARDRIVVAAAMGLLLVGHEHAHKDPEVVDDAVCPSVSHPVSHPTRSDDDNSEWETDEDFVAEDVTKESFQEERTIPSCTSMDVSHSSSALAMVVPGCVIPGDAGSLESPHQAEQSTSPRAQVRENSSGLRKGFLAQRPQQHLSVPDESLKPKKDDNPPLVGTKRNELYYAHLESLWKNSSSLVKKNSRLLLLRGTGD